MKKAFYKVTAKEQALTFLHSLKIFDPILKCFETLRRSANGVNGDCIGFWAIFINA